MGNEARVTDPFEYITVEANGIDFRVGTTGDGDRFALCLHGFPETGLAWRNQVGTLVSRGWRMWSPDLRGYGGSDTPRRMADYTVEILMDDVAALMERAGAAEAREVMLMAHDWGAVVAWLVAMRRRVDLDRLVIMNVPHPACFRREITHLRQLRRSWYAAFFQIPWLPEVALTARGGRAVRRAILDSSVHPRRWETEVLDTYVDNVLRPGGAKAMIDYYRALIRGGGARRQARLGYPVIDTPTLMIWGEQDVALDLATIRGTDAYVAELELHTIADSGHFVQTDAAEEVDRILGGWLDRDPASSTPDER